MSRRATTLALSVALMVSSTIAASRQGAPPAAPPPKPLTGTPVVAAPEQVWTTPFSAPGLFRVAAGASVVVLSTPEKLTAFASSDGHERWHRDVESAAVLAFSTDAVYVTIGGDLCALDAASGATRWSRPVSPSQISAFASAGWLLVSQGSQLQALRATDGSAVWGRTFGADVLDVTSQGTRVFLATADGWLRAVDAASGDDLWIKAQALVSKPTGLLAANDRLYFGATDGYFYYYAQSTGRYLRRSARPGGESIGRPVADAKHVYVASSAALLTALDTVSGNLRWRSELDGRAARGLVLDGTSLVVPQSSGAALLIETKHGERIGMLDAPAGGGGIFSTSLHALTWIDHMVVRATRDPVDSAAALTAYRWKTPPPAR